MNAESNKDASQKTAVVPLASTMSGSKFVVLFIAVSAIIAVLFCYAMYQSFLTRPKIQIQDEKN